MRAITSVKRITNPYSKRILSNVIGQEPLEILSSTPGRLRRLMAGLSEKQLRTKPGKGRWAIVQIVSHLADSEIVVAFRLRMAIAQSGSPLQATDQDKWAAGLKYQRASVGQKIELFTALRKDTVALLRSLKSETWHRFGMHEERGKETVERIAQMYAGHDVNHVRQVESIRRSFLERVRK